MSTKEALEYDYFKDNSDHKDVESEDVRKKWMRCKEGTRTYSMSRPKLIELARDAGAAYKIDSMILIDIEVFERYLETFKIPGKVL